MIRKIIDGVTWFLSAWEKPLVAFFLSLVIYSFLATYEGSIFKTSVAPYYNYLADAFLHFQTYLRLLPPKLLDLVYYNNHYYLYWPPMPAIILMPFVAIFGVNFSDIFFTLIIGSLNVALIATFLRALTDHGFVNLSKLQKGILTLFFAFGTVHATLAPLGRVWFTGQLVGFNFTLLAYLAAIKFKGNRGFFLTGLSLAGAMLTRNHLLFTGIWPIYNLYTNHKDVNRARLARQMALFVAPIFVGGLGYLYYNWLRFGSPFEVGLTYHFMSTNFATDYIKYGAFNLHYLPINLYYQYIYYPLPIRADSAMGGSLFLLSPVFFAIFLELRNLPRRTSAIALSASILATSVPILLLMGTGWVNFGPRYTLDFTVPLIFLTAYGIENINILRLFLLTAISITHYIRGALILSYWV